MLLKFPHFNLVCSRDHLFDRKIEQILPSYLSFSFRTFDLNQTWGQTIDFLVLLLVQNVLLVTKPSLQWPRAYETACQFTSATILSPLCLRKPSKPTLFQWISALLPHGCLFCSYFYCCFVYLVLFTMVSVKLLFIMCNSRLFLCIIWCSFSFK